MEKSFSRIVLNWCLIGSLACPPVFAGEQPGDLTPDTAAPIPTNLLGPTGSELPPLGKAQIPPQSTCRGVILGQSPQVAERVALSMAEAEKAIAKTRAEMAEITQLAAAAGACEDRTVRACASTFQLIKKLQLMIRPLEIGFRSELAAVEKEDPSGEKRRSLVQLVFAEFFKTFQKDSLTLKSLREDRDAFWNYVKSLSMIYAFQISAAATQAFVNPGYNSNTIWPILFNTGLMVTLQTNKGTEQTRKLTLPEAASLDELNAQLPAMIAGTDGYKDEIRRKGAGFVALWAPEVLVVVLIKGLVEMLSPEGVGATAFMYNTPARIVAIAAASIGIFGSYLSLRFSVFDFWFNLRYLPAYQRTVNAEFQKVDSVLQEKLKKAMAEAGVEDPGPLSTTGWVTQRFTAAGRQYRERKAAFDAFSQQPEIAALQKEIVQNRWRHRLGAAKEVGYRFGLQFFDAMIIFGLLGDWVPQLVDWVFGFHVPK